MTAASITDASWRQSEDYFNRVELQLQQKHEEILARRAALLSGKEAYYDSNTGFPELFIGSDSQAAKRNNALFETVASIRHELNRTPHETIDRCSQLKKEYIQSVQASILAWIEELRDFRSRQIQKIGIDKWRSDEDYQAIDAILNYTPDSRPEKKLSASAELLAAPAAEVEEEEAVRTSQSPQLAASVPDLSAAADADAGQGRRSRRSRLGAFLSSSWSNMRARLSRSSSRGGRGQQQQQQQQQQQAA